MERRAAANAMKGLSTRIPFLKSSLCGQTVRNGESVHSEPLRLDKDAPAGHEFSLPVNLLIYFRLGAFCREVARFNSINAAGAKQAVPVYSREPKRLVMRVTPCEVSYLGDLRVARVTGNESGLFEGINGEYNSGIYGIFLRNEQEFSAHRRVMSHELEHAQHMSLWNLAGFPIVAIRQECTEYLSMLRTLIELGEAPSLLAWRSEYLNVLVPEVKKPTPHDDAALEFVRRLMGRYKMTELDIAMGIAWSMRDDIPEGDRLDPSFSGQLTRIRSAAAGEYYETYRKLFGMDIDDIREVVSRLSP